jgi:hypothetical protein
MELKKQIGRVVGFLSCPSLYYNDKAKSTRVAWEIKKK